MPLLSLYGIQAAFFQNSNDHMTGSLHHSRLAEKFTDLRFKEL